MKNPFTRRKLTLVLSSIVLTTTIVYYFSTIKHHTHQHKHKIDQFQLPLNPKSHRIHNYPNQQLELSTKSANLETPNSQSLLDIPNFNYIQNPKDLCLQRFQNSTANKSILSLVHSARANFLSRELIRRTHGTVKSYQGYDIQVVFALGAPAPKFATEESEDPIIQEYIENEIQSHGDLIIGNFTDTYRNLTYKHLMGYKWSLEFCPEANYYLKSDDDVLVDIFHAVEFLMSNSTNLADDDDFYYCFKMEDSKPARDCDGCKWEISKNEFGSEIYPDYCGIGLYLTSSGTVGKILKMSSSPGIPFLWIDDVFVSGVLREAFNQNQENSAAGAGAAGKAKGVQLIPAVAYYEGFMEEKIEDVIGRKNCLGIVEERRSLGMSCPIWDLVLGAHGQVFESSCSGA